MRTAYFCDRVAKKRQASMRIREFSRWFAWYPVRVGGQTVWLEVVERRLVCSGVWNYRDTVWALTHRRGWR